MAITRDGITAPLAPSPLWLLVGVAELLLGVYLVVTGPAVAGVGLAILGVLTIVNQKGSRRIRVIHSKLLVEDERLIVGLLIGPRRRRIDWSEVRGVAVDGGALVLKTDAAPFVTADGSPADELEALRQRCQDAWNDAKNGVALTP